MMSIRRLARMADPGSGDDDEAVVAAYFSRSSRGARRARQMVIQLA